jgi:putative endonuclease
MRYNRGMGDGGRLARGKVGEAAAQTLLEQRGYVIVDVNVRFGRSSGLIGELDIVAWDGATLCFIEVKTRRGSVGKVVPAENVTPAKQRQIARLALAYAAQNGMLDDDAEIPMRFDVAAVYLAPGEEATVRHVELFPGAFVAPENFEEG